MDQAHLGDLKPDKRNARAHNPRNIGMVEQALHEVGAARSIVIDEENTILAGNGVVEAAAQAGIENVQIVEADGNTIIAVRRRGLSDEQKRRLAYFDNRTAELAAWDATQIAADLEEGLSFDGLFYPDELNAILERAADMLLPDPEPQKEPELKAEHFIEIYCSAADLDEFRATLNTWGKRPGVTVNIS